MKDYKDNHPDAPPQLIESFIRKIYSQNTMKKAAKELRYENLGALVRGHELNIYQLSKANTEYLSLIEQTEQLQNTIEEKDAEIDALLYKKGEYVFAEQFKALQKELEDLKYENKRLKKWQTLGVEELEKENQQLKDRVKKLEEVLLNAQQCVCDNHGLWHEIEQLLNKDKKPCPNCGCPSEKRGEDYWCKNCHNEF